MTPPLPDASTSPLPKGDPMGDLSGLIDLLEENPSAFSDPSQIPPINTEKIKSAAQQLSAHGQPIPPKPSPYDYQSDPPPVFFDDRYLQVLEAEYTQRPANHFNILGFIRRPYDWLVTLFRDVNRLAKSAPKRAPQKPKPKQSVATPTKKSAPAPKIPSNSTVSGEASMDARLKAQAKLQADAPQKGTST